MNNAEFFKDAAALKAAHLAFNEIFKDVTDGRIKSAVEDPYVFATKQADLALQDELKVGSLVQIKVNLHGEGLGLKYATVAGHKAPNKGGLGIPFVNKVLLRFATGEEYLYDVRKKVYGSLYPEKDMSDCDLKVAEVPADLVKLMGGCVNLEKCPLKKEGACLEA